VSGVLGVTAEGTRLFAIHGGKPGCLGTIEPPPQFTVVNSTCSLNLGLDDRVYASPSGKWVLVLGATGYAVYEAAGMWSKPQSKVAGPLDGTGATGSWLDDQSFAVYSKGRVYRFVLGDGYNQQFDVPDPNAAGARSVIEDVR
jgi:hypothetical protein